GRRKIAVQGCLRMHPFEEFLQIALYHLRTFTGGRFTGISRLKAILFKGLFERLGTLLARVLIGVILFLLLIASVAFAAGIDANTTWRAINRFYGIVHHWAPSR